MINFLNLHKSIEFYEEKGFVRIESSWTVSKATSEITKPPEKIDYQLKHNKKVLVASGEQSFLYLYLKGFVPKGKFQTITPCFRDEEFDDIHSKYFMKNELIITDKPTIHNLHLVIDTARQFFEKMLGDKVDVIKLKDSFDISYKKIELGSYGMRQCSYLQWIYGTGCAEPRLSFCQENAKNK